MQSIKWTGHWTRFLIMKIFRAISALHQGRPWSSFAKRPPAPLSPKLEQLPAHCHRRGGGVPEPCHQLLHFHHVANEGGTRKFEKFGLENMECSSARPNTRNLAKLEQLPAHCHRGGGGVLAPNVLRQNGTRFCIFTMWPMKVMSPAFTFSPCGQ